MTLPLYWLLTNKPKAQWYGQHCWSLNTNELFLFCLAGEGDERACIGHCAADRHRPWAPVCRAGAQQEAGHPGRLQVCPPQVERRRPQGWGSFPSIFRAPLFLRYFPPSGWQWSLKSLSLCRMMKIKDLKSCGSGSAYYNGAKNIRKLCVKVEPNVMLSGMSHGVECHLSWMSYGEDCPIERNVLWSWMSCHSSVAKGS